MSRRECMLPWLAWLFLRFLKTVLIKLCLLKLRDFSPALQELLEFEVTLRGRIGLVVEISAWAVCDG